MSSLYLRIYATLVVVLLLFASASGWLFQRHLEQERGRADSVLTERMGAWAELIQRSLPGTDAPTDDQAVALRDWSQRLRLPLALDSAAGQRIASSESYLRRQQDGAQARGLAVRLEDGRTLWIMRPGPRRPGGGGGAAMGGGSAIGTGAGADVGAKFGANMGANSGPSNAAPGPRSGADRPLPFLPFVPPAWQQGVGLVILLALLFVAVAAGAFPVVRRLTRRLEALKQGVEQFGAGQLSHRVAVSGHDEVAAVATSFNVAAAQVQALVESHRSLLANASHELRSPLARMKLAVALLDDAPPTQRERLKREIDTNVAELDALVEEVLLASRLDAATQLGCDQPVELLGLAAEEAARLDASTDGEPLTVIGDERLLRRALRNLLENARRYGGGAVEVEVEVEVLRRAGQALLRVCDRGPGVPEAMRERIFEPFFRMPGHAEQAGGVGLGLSLVRQIALRHGGSVRCAARAGGGSCFEILLPLRR